VFQTVIINLFGRCNPFTMHDILNPRLTYVPISVSRQPALRKLHPCILQIYYNVIYTL